MPDEIETRGDVTVLLCAEDGPVIAGDGDCMDVIASALAQRADVVVVPAQRLSADFFRLRTGVAGEILQKFVNYRLVLAIVGDISAHVAASTALRDLVREANRGRHTWFLPTLDALNEQLPTSSRGAHQAGVPEA